MKFLSKESNFFKESISKEGLPLESFSFIKKRGSLYIDFLKREAPFIFHRKKYTEINGQGKWQDRVEYFVGKEKNDSIVWKQVQQKFELWLKMIN